MAKLGTQEKYLIIFGVLLACVMILASAGLEIAKQNDNEIGNDPLVEGSDEVHAENIETVSTVEVSDDDILNVSTSAEGYQITGSVNESATEPTSDQTSANGDKVTLSVSGCLEYVSPEEMSTRSDVILIGTVKEILPAQWNTADGGSPTDDINELEWYDISTDVVIIVDEYLKNPLAEKEVIVRTLGGEKDIIIIDVEDEPSFTPGEKVFLYLKNDTWPRTMDHGPEHFVVTGVSQGKFTLTNDGKAIHFGESFTLDELLETV
ncbi:hypothetical protein [Methanococcoides methylutens]|uniref:hypothetical protein n=1 Tax=Methanococcoides methylutens TaxID=2226 RepID=UPI000A84F27C|nr:hypothetical protein [Methanococcoides methylutens]